MAVAHNFDRLPRDLRPIGYDLAKVVVNLDPRGMIHSWTRLFSKFLGHHTMPPHMKQRVLLTFAPTAFDIYNGQDAREWLRKENDDWRKETFANGNDAGQVLAENLEEARLAILYRRLWCSPREPGRCLQH
jgi:hypothetical protein